MTEILDGLAMAWAGLLQTAILAILGIALYRDVWAAQFSDWFSTSGSSFGLVGSLLAVVWMFRSRGDLRQIQPRTSWVGLVPVALGCALLTAGRFAVENFTSRLSALILLAGLLWMFLGLHAVVRLILPLLLIATTITLPSIVYNPLSGLITGWITAICSNLASSLGLGVYFGTSVEFRGAAYTLIEITGGLRAIPAAVIVALASAALRTRLVGILLVPVFVFTWIVLRILTLAWLADSHGDSVSLAYRLTDSWIMFLLLVATLWLIGKLLTPRASLHPAAPVVAQPQVGS
jgi:hypothetical protein